VATSRSERLDIRVSSGAKRLLQKAADLRHKSVSEFVLDSALGAAEEALIEERRIGLNAEQWETFMAALDAPVRDAPHMAALLRSESPFE
jgi:uncharacterized protein (DUF1778 family)